jgi:hypothetical protein
MRALPAPKSVVAKHPECVKQPYQVTALQLLSPLLPDQALNVLYSETAHWMHILYIGHASTCSAGIAFTAKPKNI